MCRIAGIINKHQHVANTQRSVTAMCRVLAHGGPDDEGIYVDENDSLAFGHRRLAIIDLSANGHQPMADTDRKVWVTFNGEIYNYIDLRKDLLLAGLNFSTETDTEVVIKAYRYWGTAAFARFRGMFAFALHDTEKRLVYLVRDTMGVKPLYYYAHGSTFSFSSELKAFKAGGIETMEDPAWRIKFLAFGHIPEPATTLKNVFSLPKGHFLTYNLSNNAFQTQSYAEPSVAGPYIKNAEDAHEAIATTLRSAMKRQLTADAPIGIFLSGGIDSSLLTLLAAEYKGPGLNTVSLYFNDDAYDEQAYQSIVSAKIPGEKFSHLVTQHDFNEGFSAFITALDMPTTDGINSWFISKYARQDGLKAVLSGLGADELFGGYPSFNRVGSLQLLQKLPPAALKLASYFLDDRYKKLNYLSRPGNLSIYLALRAFFVPNEIAQLLDCDEQQVYDELFGATIQPEQNMNGAELASWLETNLYMQNQLLRDADVMGMSHGLEVRVPFLDEDLYRVVNNIHPQIRFNKRQPKKILIDSFNNLLPKPIWNRPKMGFTFPLQKWMRDHDTITDLNLYKGGKSKQLISDFKNNRLHWSKAFALYLALPHAQ